MIKLFDMFAGYGGGSFALKKAGIPFECVGYSEIDKYAIQCYEQNHSGKNFGDCKMINPNDIPDFDLLTGGFPCQDVSIAGKRDLEKGRTNLYLEILRIAEAKKPKYILLENVKGLLSMGKTEKIGRDNLLIHKIVKDLNNIGYGVCWKVLNSKDFGIPQSRERVWFVCKYGGWDFMEFQFPIEEKLNIFIKDILEESVDEKYYLSDKLQERFTKYLEEKQNSNLILKNHRANEIREYKDVSPTLTESHDHKGGTNAPIVMQKNCLGTIQETCQKRTFETPKEINHFLRSSRQGISLKEVSEKLNLPKTQIEHYFRCDKSRSVPSPDIWLKLKELLSFDDRFDKQVTEIYEKEIEFEQTRRVWNDEGTSPTLNTIKEPIIFDKKGVNEIKREQLDISGKGYASQEDRMYHIDGIMGRIPNANPSNKVCIIEPPKISNSSPREVGFKENIYPTLLGRDYKDPKIVSQPKFMDKIIDAINKQGDLTEPKVLDLYNRKADNNVSQTLTDPCHNSLRLMNQGKLRRLTPKECFRLMGFFDDEIKLDSLSDTQKYKLAGNGWAMRPASDILKNMLKGDL